MNRRRTRKERREAFEELQKRKKRKLQTSEERLREMDNSAKSSVGSNKGRQARSGQQSTGGRGKKRKRNKRPHRFGMCLVALQAIVSILFVAMLCIMGAIPVKFIVAGTILLAFLCIIAFMTQTRRNKRAIGGKILSGILIVSLSFGTYYIGKANGALDRITSGGYKIDNMIVAVLKDNPADKISDTKDFTFGVQYKMGENDVVTAIQDINEELGVEIKTVEYADIHEQTQALQDKLVDAIIYNEAYTENISEFFEGYKQKTKIIYRHKIKKEITGRTVSANIKEPFNVYVSGIDVYGDIEQTSRSDVNIIATVNPVSHQVLLTTTPRDYYVPLPGVSDGQGDKLTHAGTYGVDVSMRTLEQLYDIEIPFYARINFTSLIEIVDQLGGVDVYSEYSFKTGWESGLVMNVQEGINHFNGEQALAFSRERKNVPNGDNQRGKNQQAVITGMIKKMISPQILIKASGIIDSVSGNVETNMSDKQIQSLIKMQLEKGGGWNIYSVAAEGTGGKDYCYSSSQTPLYVTYPDDTSVANIRDMIKRVEAGEVLEGSEMAE